MKSWLSLGHIRPVIGQIYPCSDTSISYRRVGSCSVGFLSQASKTQSYTSQAQIQLVWASLLWKWVETLQFVINWLPNCWRQIVLLIHAWDSKAVIFSITWANANIVARRGYCLPLLESIFNCFVHNINWSQLKIWAFSHIDFCSYSLTSAHAHLLLCRSKGSISSVHKGTGPILPRIMKTSSW